MKTTTDKLFRLIKSMSPAEKRYFKRHYGSDSNTLTHLFDAINQQKEYDEEQVKAGFPEKVAMNLKVYKFQLEQLLLKSLISHRHFTSIGSKIRLGLEQVEILIEKNLLGMARKQLAKVKQQCLENEEFAYLSVVSEMEVRLKFIQLNGQPSKKSNYGEEANFYLKKQENYVSKTRILNQLCAIYNKKGPLSSKEKQYIQEWASMPVSENGQDTEAYALRSKMLESIRRAVSKLLGGANEEALQYFASIRKQFNASPVLQVHYAHFYVITLRCTLDAAFIQCDVELIRDVLEEAKSFCEQNEPYRIQLLLFLAYEVQLFILLGEEDKVIEKLDTQYLPLTEELDDQDKYSCLVLLSWLTIANIVAGKQTQWAGNLARRIQHTKLAEFKALGWIIELVAYFEQPDFQKMAQLLERVREDKTLKLKGKKAAFYNRFMEFGNRIASNPRIAVTQAKELFAELPDNPSDPVLELFYRFKLDKWLQSIIQEDSFKEVLEQSFVTDKKFI